MRVLSKLFVVLLVVAIVAAIAWWWAGRAGGPTLVIRQPEKVIGQATPLAIDVSGAGSERATVAIVVEQGGHTYTVPGSAQSIGKKTIPDLQAGPARLVVRASRPALFGLRRLTSEATRDLTVRLDPPRVSEVSTFHYINQGGAEFVVYRATPADVDSGVRVGDRTYPGFPASAIGANAGDGLHVVFFALLFDQDPNAAMLLYARDAAGNEAATPLDHKVFPKPFARSRIEIDDKLLQRVVPAIAATTPDMNLSTAPDQLVASFLRINNELRRRNNQTIAEQAKKTAPEMLWRDAFQPLVNAAIESKFADSRTYIYQGREIDHQVHLGFDLAVTTHIPVLAANRGKVVFAGDLGIYGNCIIVDHGLGVQSLYAHLSSMDVKAGDTVDKAQPLGKSGMTGLAGGDHLHFTMLVNGQPVNPIEWWDPKWMQDRVLRKIADAGGTQSAAR
jgi:murein DD-endopeptidase MepM/ murein hydrolase activator NlpD